MLSRLKKITNSKKSKQKVKFDEKTEEEKQENTSSLRIIEENNENVAIKNNNININHGLNSRGSSDASSTSIDESSRKASLNSRNSTIN